MIIAIGRELVGFVKVFYPVAVPDHQPQAAQFLSGHCGINNDSGRYGLWLGREVSDRLRLAVLQNREIVLRQILHKSPILVSYGGWNDNQIDLRM